MFVRACVYLSLKREENQLRILCVYRTVTLFGMRVRVVIYQVYLLHRIDGKRSMSTSDSRLHWLVEWLLMLLETGSTKKKELLELPGTYRNILGTDLCESEINQLIPVAQTILYVRLRTYVFVLRLCGTEQHLEFSFFRFLPIGLLCFMKMLCGRS